MPKDKAAAAPNWDDAPADTKVAEQAAQVDQPAAEPDAHVEQAPPAHVEQAPPAYVEPERPSVVTVKCIVHTAPWTDRKALALHEEADVSLELAELLISKKLCVPV